MSEHWPLVPLAPETIALLTRRRQRDGETLNDVVVRLLKRDAGAVPASRPTAASTRTHGPRAVHYELLGRHEVAADATEAMVSILRTLQTRDSSFLERLSHLVAGRSRNHVARSRAQVYPDRPDLAQEYTVEVVPGWFVGTNIANREKQNLLEKACEAARLKLGGDMKISLQTPRAGKPSASP